MLIGREAPDFTLRACAADNSFISITLSSFRGQHVILFFYDANFHAVSATELAGLEKLAGEFTKRKCVVLGICSDSESSHMVWKTMPQEMGGIGDISYSLLSDPLREVANTYDCVLPNGKCGRSVFLIDDNQIVQAEQCNNLPLGRNLDELVRLLDAVQFHEESVLKGATQVIPACWVPGCVAMHPTVEGIADFAATGGLDRYVKMAPGNEREKRVIYISPIVGGEDKMRTPINVKVNLIRTANKLSDLPLPKRSDYTSSFMHVRNSPGSMRSNCTSNVGMSPSFNQNASYFGSPSSRPLARRISDLWTV